MAFKRAIDVTEMSAEKMEAILREHGRIQIASPSLSGVLVRLSRMALDMQDAKGSYGVDIDVTETEVIATIFTRELN